MFSNFARIIVDMTLIDHRSMHGQALATLFARLPTVVVEWRSAVAAADGWVVPAAPWLCGGMPANGLFVGVGSAAGCVWAAPAYLWESGDAAEIHVPDRWNDPTAWRLTTAAGPIRSAAADGDPEWSGQVLRSPVSARRCAQCQRATWGTWLCPTHVDY
jgi:hypothetical protein